MRAGEFLNNMAATGVTLGRGIASEPAAMKPKQPLALYEMEGCPFCRIVREALTALDLDAVIYPCPKAGLRFRPLVRELGGKEQFPFLVDPNTGVSLYESSDIVDYLYATYSGRQAPSPLRLKALVLPGSMVASALRGGRGLHKRKARVPSQLLELWSFEGSPFARPVKELLCELEIPYLLHNVGKGSPSREAFVRRSGKMMVPYLVDPNTGREMFESGDIVAYLYETYAK